MIGRILPTCLNRCNMQVRLPLCRYVGYATTTQWDETTHDKLQMIGFDMGGTSTDVSRFAGTFEHVFESTTAGKLWCTILSLGYFAGPPQLLIVESHCRCDNPGPSA